MRWCVSRHPGRRWVASAIGAVAALAAPLAATAGTGAVEQTATVTQVRTHRVVWPVRRAEAPRPGLRGPGTCSTVVTSLATGFDALDVGSEITMQAGMVEQEGFGQTYIVPDPNPATPQNEAFPIEINLVEVIAATVGTLSGSNGQQIRLGYVIEVYDGEPTSGNTPVFTASSTDDPQNNPDLPEDLLIDRLPSGACSPCATSGLSASVAKLQFSVDASSAPADRIFVQGNDNVNGVATGRFTVMVRITRMNDPAPYGACNFGITNACGPLNRCHNAFLATESNSGGSLNFPSRNWISIRPCGAFACAGGVYRFSQLSAGGGLSTACRPSRDTLIQVSFSPASCAVATSGACCAASGACAISTQAACTGTYQGSGAICSPNPCPQPGTGACCINGACTSRTDAACIGAGGVFQGTGSVCAATACPEAGGACCVPGFGCAPGSRDQCALAPGSIYQGDGTVCGPTPPGGLFPECGSGACCAATGTCTAGLTAAQCTAVAGRVYQGNATTCGPATCPVPLGACCFSNGACLDRISSQCLPLGGVFQTGTCSPSPCRQPGVCCRGATCAIGVTQAGCVGVGTAGAAYATGSAACNASGSALTPCCFANFNKQGPVDLLDIFAFLEAWFAGNPYARIGGDGTVQPDLLDIFSFLELWFAGGCQ